MGTAAEEQCQAPQEVLGQRLWEDEDEEIIFGIQKIRGQGGGQELNEGGQPDHLFSF